MQVTNLSREGNVAKFSIDFSADEFERAQLGAYKKEKHKYAVDGFRKGKAPKKIIEARYGEGVFYEEAVNALFAESYQNALDELGLSDIDRPELDLSDLKRGEGFTMSLSVQVEPEVDVKGYKGVTVKAPNNKVSDMDVDNELEGLRKRNARLVLADKAAAADDVVLIDYAGFVGETQFEGGTAERQSLKLGSGTFIPGFEEQLIGTKQGDEKDVKVTFPEEYHAEELAGKEAVFRCKVHEVKTEELPKLDDEFAQEASEFDTLEALREDIRKRLEKSAEKKNEYELKNSVLEKVFEANEVELPEVMVEEEISTYIQELSQQLKVEGLNLEGYMSFMKKDMATLREEIKPDAVRKAKTRLIVKAVAKAEGITATDEDVEREIAEMAAQYKTDVENLRKVMGPPNIKLMKEDIRNRKAVDLMVANATVE
jgi:trigger factor